MFSKFAFIWSVIAYTLSVSCQEEQLLSTFGTNEESVEIFYINFDPDLTHKIERHLNDLGYLYQRIDPVTVDSFTAIKNNEFNLDDYTYPCEKTTEPIKVGSPFYQLSSLQINKLCVDSTATLKAISITLSHLKAILAAISSTSSHPYAMIMEDDMQFAFHINFKELISYLPKSAAILQTYVSHYHHPSLFKENHSNDIIRSRAIYKSTSGYIIHKKRFIEYLNSTGLLDQQGEFFEYDLIAATNESSSSMCLPSICCEGGQLQTKYPCVHLKRSFSPGHFLHSFFPRRIYTTSIPLLIKYKANQPVSPSLRAIYTRNVDLPSYAKFIKSADSSRSIEIYYVNMKQSVARDDLMRSHLATLGYPYYRVEAIDIPSQVSEEYNISQAMQPCELTANPLIIPSSILNSKSIQINNLCIHDQNFMKEIACTLSHIKAILSAISSSSSDSQYAVILEDDMTVAFDVDFEAMISHYPDDFGIIQLFIMNPKEQSRLLEEYIAKKFYVLWEPLFWSTGGYIINKSVLKPILESLLQQSNHDVFTMDLIAGSNRLTDQGKDITPSRFTFCWPEKCCQGKTFMRGFPCILTPHGVAADYYIYNLAFGKTYATTFPILMGSSESYSSTIHANHTGRDALRIKNMRLLISDLYNGKINPPHYALLRYDGIYSIEILYISSQEGDSIDIDMKAHLDVTQLSHRRIEAITLNGTGYAFYDLPSVQLPCDKPVSPLWFTTNIYSRSTYVKIESLCIGPENTITDVAKTISHLKSIISAYDKGTFNKYVLILKDNVKLAFQIDVKALMQAIPSDCAILQMSVDNDEHIGKLRRLYLKKHVLFTRWQSAYSSVGGYLVNKKVFFDHLNSTGLFLQQGRDVFKIDLLAGSNVSSYGCAPAACCDGNHFIKRFPCVDSINNIAPEQYLYNIVHGKSYVSTIPLVYSIHRRISGEVSNAKEMIQDAYARQMKLPPFMGLFNVSPFIW